jgi:hypothetical protein
LTSSLVPKYEFAIPNNGVNSVLGRGGSNISHIHEIFGATVKLCDPIIGSSYCVIEILGNLGHSHATHILIQDFMLTIQSQ